MRKYKERYEKQDNPATFVILTTRAIKEHPGHIVVLIFEKHEVSCKVGN